MKEWYLLPAFAGAVGGIVAYYILRFRDPRTAVRCLYVGTAAGAAHAALGAAMIPYMLSALP